MRTWAEIKAAIEAAGVKDADQVFSIDIGPTAPIQIDRDRYGWLEISSDALLESDDRPWQTRPQSPTKKASRP